MKTLPRLPVPLIMAIGFAVLAQGAMIVQYDPAYEIGIHRVLPPIEITNNDNGAVYNSFDLYLFNSLKHKLFALPHNQARYASADELADDWSLGINSSGEVYMGWSVVPGDY